MNLKKLIFWRKGKAPEKEERPVTMFGCPEKAAIAQKEIDDAREKSDTAAIQVTQVITLFGNEVRKMGENNT